MTPPAGPPFEAPPTRPAQHGSDRERQDSTGLRDGLMPALDTTMQNVQDRGTVGLPDRPDLLELLGLPPA